MAFGLLNTPSRLLQETKDHFFPNLSDLKETLHSINEEEAIGATQRLGEIGSEEALKILKAAEIKSDRVRNAIDQAIDQIAQKSGWIEKLERATKLEEKQKAIEELRKIGGKRVIAVLIDALTKEKDFEARAHLKLAIHRVKHLEWATVAEGFLGKGEGYIHWSVKKMNDQLINRPGDVTLRQKLGEAYYMLGEYEKAEAEWKKINPIEEMRKDEAVAKARNGLGILALKEGSLDKAIHYFQEATDYSPDFAAAWANMGKTLEQSGNPRAAAEAYNQAFLRKPDPEISFNLGNAYALQDEYRLAILMLEEAVSLETNRTALGFIYNNLGVVHLLRGVALNEAIEAFQSAVNLVPEIVEFRYNFGVAYFNEKNWGRAIEQLAIVLEKRQKDGSWETLEEAAREFSMLALAYARNGQSKQAIRSFEMAVQYSPDDSQLHNDLANAYVLDKQFDKAIQGYKKAINLKKRPDFYLNLAYAYEIMEKFDKALKYYRLVLELNPDFYAVHYYIAQIFERRNNLLKALKHYKVFMERATLDERRGVQRDVERVERTLEK